MNKPLYLGPNIFRLNVILNQILETSVITSVNSSLTSIQAKILVFVSAAARRDEDVFQRDIQQVFNLRRSSVSLFISNMERKQLVRRVEVLHDTRLRKIELTEKAQAIADELTNEFTIIEDKLVQGIDPDDVERFSVVLEQLLANAQRLV